MKDAFGLASVATGKHGPADTARWLGARYLAGIAVECYLKWAVCQTNGCDYVDEFDADLVGGQGHNLSRLLESARLGYRVRGRFAEDWRLIEGWSIHERYEPRSTNTVKLREAERFVSACGRLINWMESAVVG